MKLRYRAQALADIKAIETFLTNRSPNGAQAVSRAIFASMQLIADHPQSYPCTDDPQIRVHVVQRYRYKIFYATVGDTVEIVHVRHGARRGWTTS